MEKETIQIRKIKDVKIVEITDEVAVEQELVIELKGGDHIHVTCTPTHIEELILGRRYLEDDMTEKELEQLSLSKGQSTSLQEVSLEEVFVVAKNFFENPSSLFADTGCAHSCALIHEGKVICTMDDVGRHNALDKVIGYAIKHQIPCADSYIFASGRIAGDYIQKAHKAGFPMVASRAAVTSSAVAFAKEKDITLLGFIRKNTGNIYHEGKVRLNG